MDRLQRPITRHERTQLRGQLARLRGLPPGSLAAAFDVDFDLHAELEEEAETVFFVASDAGREKGGVFRFGEAAGFAPSTGDFGGGHQEGEGGGAPFGAEVVFGRVSVEVERVSPTIEGCAMRVGQAHSIATKILTTSSVSARSASVGAVPLALKLHVKKLLVRFRIQVTMEVIC